jgi:hypothetical protein
MSDKPKSGATRAVLLLAFSALAGCADEGPEARLLAVVEQMEAAVEARRPVDFIAHVDESFTNRDGLDRQSLRGVLASQVMGNQQVEVILGSPEIVLHGDRATLTVDATLIGGRYLPERGERLRITSGWRDVDGEWVCYTADWERL